MADRGMTMARFWALGERGRPETFLIGAGLVLLGIYALAAPFLSGGMTVLALGVILVAAGGIELLHGVILHGEANWAVFVLSGTFSALMGLLLVRQPAVELGATTFLVAGYFIVGGLFQAGSAVLERYPGWGWHLAAGTVSLVLGSLVVARFPWATVPIIGTLVGLELLLRGVTTAGSGLRRGARPTPALH